MTQKQLPVPTSSQEDNPALQCYVDDAGEITPGVQVTLAKRIIRAGSNKMVCLAARTSVPFHDDEIASVSDLALKLADGTNVALSLSFFNDSVAPGYIPVNRYIYDPNRYSARDDSKLGIVIVAIVLVALAGTYSLATGPLKLHLFPQKADRTFVRRASRLPLKPHAQALPVASASLIPVLEPSPKPVLKPHPRQKGETRSFPKEVSHSQPLKSSRTKEPHLSKDMMFVPPPPPTPYIMPSGVPSLPFTMPFAAPANAAEAAAPPAAKPAAKSKSAARTVQPVSAEVAVKAAKPVSNPPQKLQDIDRTTFSEIAPDVPRYVPPHVSQSEPVVEKALNAPYTSAMSAPLPGNDPDTTAPLERIVPPTNP